MAGINIRRDWRYGNHLQPELPQTYKRSANTALGPGSVEEFTQGDGRVVKKSGRGRCLDLHCSQGE